MKDRIIFKNVKHQKSFDEKGFVHFNLLTDEEVKKLQQLYSQIESEIDKSNTQKYSSAQDMDTHRAKEISNEILKLVEPILSDFIENYEALAAAFLVKPPRQTSNDAIPWHQALTLVDETQFEAAMAWIGLEEKKGANWLYYLVPGSHFFEDLIRTAPKYTLYFNQYKPFFNALAIKTPLKQGEILVFNNRLLNRSPENRANIESKAIQIALKPSKAKWQYLIKEKGSISIFNASKDFYFSLWTQGFTQLPKHKIETKKLIEKKAKLKDFFKLIYNKVFVT